MTFMENVRKDYKKYKNYFMFTITVAGGLGSIDGVMLATLLIGFLEVAVVTLVDPRLKSVVILTVGLLILIFRPRGFAGKRIG